MSNSAQPNLIETLLSKLINDGDERSMHLAVELSKQIQAAELTKQIPAAELTKQIQEVELTKQIQAAELTKQILETKQSKWRFFSFHIIIIIVICIIICLFDSKVIFLTSWMLVF